MSFRLRTDAVKWFGEIEGREPIKTLFDLYYFCAMAGLSSGRFSDPVKLSLPTREMVDYFVEDYRSAQRLIIGLLVIAELRRVGIGFGEKAAVRDEFKRLVSPNSPSNLTDEGFKVLNGYASGGYEFLSESRETKPASVDEFLRDYLLLIDEATALAP